MVSKGGIEGRLVEALSGHPGLVLHGPVGTVAPHPPVAEQELARTMAHPRAIDNHVGALPAKVPHGFFGLARHPHRGELPRAKQQSKEPRIALVGLHVVASAVGMRAWVITSQRTPIAWRWRASS